jgi:hypothetical protein
MVACTGTPDFLALSTLSKRQIDRHKEFLTKRLILEAMAGIKL